MIRQKPGCFVNIASVAGIFPYCDGGQAVGYYLSVPGRRFSGGRID